MPGLMVSLMKDSMKDKIPITEINLNSQLYFVINNLSLTKNDQKTKDLLRLIPDVIERFSILNLPYEKDTFDNWVIENNIDPYVQEKLKGLTKDFRGRINYLKEQSDKSAIANLLNSHICISEITELSKLIEFEAILLDLNEENKFTQDGNIYIEETTKKSVVDLNFLPGFLNLSNRVDDFIHNAESIEKVEDKWNFLMHRLVEHNQGITFIDRFLGLDFLEGEDWVNYLIKQLNRSEYRTFKKLKIYTNVLNKKEHEALTRNGWSDLERVRKQKIEKFKEEFETRFPKRNFKTSIYFLNPHDQEHNRHIVFTPVLARK